MLGQMAMFLQFFMESMMIQVKHHKTIKDCLRNKTFLKCLPQIVMRASALTFLPLILY